MQKAIVTICALIICCTIQADELEKSDLLMSKIVLQNSDAYFALADGTIWKVTNFVKRWRSLTEWWRDERLIPEEYECTPHDWPVGIEIEVYSKYKNPAVEANASNQKALQACSHLLVNPRNSQILFATALHPVECLHSLFQDAHTEGYEEGFTKGRNIRHTSHASAYKEGYDRGYKDGYKEAFQDDAQPPENVENR